MSFNFDTTGIESFVTNKDAESNVGVWVPFPGDREFRLLRAGGSNRVFTRAYQRAMQPHQRALKLGTHDENLIEDIGRRIYAKHIIKDWRGIRDANTGEEIPYSEEACVAYLKAFPDLFVELMSISSNMATFSIENVQEAQVQLGED